MDAARAYLEGDVRLGARDREMMMGVTDAAGNGQPREKRIRAIRIIR
jgi:hypothetical protein